MREIITLYDTTLRDGQQTPGIDFSLMEKQTIAHMLDDFGLDYIEGGYPGANPTDTNFFLQKPTTQAKFSAFGMTKRVGISASNDHGLNILAQAQADAICLVAKTWDYHVRIALGCSNEENLQAIQDSVAFIKNTGKESIIDCEHFFDGFKANPQYALSCAKAAYDSGARWVVLCDTNGGTQPSEISSIVKKVVEFIPGTHLGIHSHDDTGQAVANSLAAIEAGVRHVQGTLNGIGERCGNANLITLIATLSSKPFWNKRFKTNISPEKLQKITQLSHSFDAILNRNSNEQAAFVGTSAFATKAGIHASALLKEPETYEHITPQSVGNKRRVMVSDQGGKANFIAELCQRNIMVKKNDPRLDQLIAIVKEREAAGYAYESADASFELLARKHLGILPVFFHIQSFRCMVEQHQQDNGSTMLMSEAVVKLRIDDEMHMSVAEGHGPVNALDIALRKDLGKYQNEISDMALIDYKVRILNGGTEAITRVLIESQDKSGMRWRTVGVSDNIIDASFQALQDSVIYKLLKNRIS